jgi:alcohol dehydrogenase
MPYSQSRPLVIEDVELERPGPHEVLIEIAAAGLCHSDLSSLAGVRVRPLPTVVGHEGSGIVREIGPGVNNVEPDDHVVLVFVGSCGTCEFCVQGRANLCQASWRSRAEGTLQTGVRRLSIDGRPVNHYGGISAFAEYAVVSENSVIKIPNDIPLEDAALFGCAVATGVGAVLNTAKVAAGSTVAVVGLGGVGLSALLGAGVAGASRIAAIDISDRKLELARDLGATDIFDARDAQCASRVREVMAGGAQFVFETAGAPGTMALAYDVTRRGGMTVTVGLPAPKEVLQIPLASLVSDERVIAGSYMGSCVPRRDIPLFVELYRRGRLPIDRLRSKTIGFDDLNAGFDRLARGESIRDLLLPRK